MKRSRAPAAWRSLLKGRARGLLPALRARPRCTSRQASSRMRATCSTDVTVLLGPAGLAGVWRTMPIPLCETPFFSAGPEPEVAVTPLARVGVNICFDALLHVSARLLAVENVELVLCRSCSRRSLTRHCGGLGGLGASCVAGAMWGQRYLRGSFPFCGTCRLRRRRAGVPRRRCDHRAEGRDPRKARRGRGAAAAAGRRPGCRTPVGGSLGSRIHLPFPAPRVVPPAGAMSDVWIRGRSLAPAQAHWGSADFSRRAARSSPDGRVRRSARQAARGPRRTDGGTGRSRTPTR